jgi:DNA-binding XRE family transcriptional regulator
MIVDGKLYKIIGERIAAKRKELGMTQDDLAHSVGLLRTSITNIEAGRQKAPLHLLFRLCTNLGIELVSIMPSNKQVAQNHTLSLDIDGTKEDVPVTINGLKDDVSDDTHKTIEELMQKIK